MEFKTTTPLHIGSGETQTAARQDRPGSPKKTYEYKAVARSVSGPYVPATGFKGSFRTFCLGADAELAGLMGEEGCAGAFEFGDAEPLGVPQHPARYANVAIDRVTRTASDQRLAHTEAVAAGACFEMEVLIRRPEEQVAKSLAAALKAFADGTPRLGAGTGDGWGAILWTKARLDYIDRDELAKVLGSSPEGPPPLPWTRQSESSSLDGEGEGKEGPTIKFDIEFSGAFLIQSHPDEPKEKEPIGSVPEGLTSSSLRGALRAQAERILRTLHGDSGACQIGDPCAPLRAVEDLDQRPLTAADVDQMSAAASSKRRPPLCRACRLFGATGWRSPLRIRVRRDGDPPVVKQQQFVAIDRFTGGVAGKKLFATSRPWRPRFHVSLGLDLGRLAGAGASDWGLGLLALVLRDLAEGDVALGWGASKGYGVVKPFSFDFQTGVFKDVDLDTQVKSLSERR